MNQRLLVLKFWEESKQRAEERPAVSETRGVSVETRDVSSAKDAALQKKADEFFRLVAERGDLHWDELAKKFREEYYDAFDLIIPPLLATDDPLIVYNCLRLADLSDPKEAGVFKKFVRECDIEKHQATLYAISEWSGSMEDVDIWDVFWQRFMENRDAIRRLNLSIEFGSKLFM